MERKQEQDVKAKQHSRQVIYRPKVRPGHTAWVGAFAYGDGSVGLSFKETLQTPNREYTPPTLEYGEAITVTVSYCSVFCSMPDYESQRVYLRSFDNGRTYTETGRCLESEGSFCNVGFPDGSIWGFHTPAALDAECNFIGGIQTRISEDGGTSWRTVSEILQGQSINLWRARKLKNGTIVLLASFVATPWGPKEFRKTRTTCLAGETQNSKIRTFFLTTTDGIHFSGPHYILPLSGAQEYDVAELPNGRLVFIAGDVQGSAAVRQEVFFQNGMPIAEPMYPILRGAPQDPVNHSQGGFVPETLCLLEDGGLIGARRNKVYSYSPDYGLNWFEVSGLPESLYQPFMLQMPNGDIANFGHYGGDTGFGQKDMYIGVDIFTLESKLPKPVRLSIERVLSPDGSYFTNGFKARLLRDTGGTAQEEATGLGGKTIIFRFQPCWNSNGSFSHSPMEDAALQLHTVTAEDGTAFAEAKEYNNKGDLYFSFMADAVYVPQEGDGFMPCQSPIISTPALRPHRRCLYPYAAYLAEGELFLAPEVWATYPEAAKMLAPYFGRPEGVIPAGVVPRGLADILVQAGVAEALPDDALYIKTSVHAAAPLVDVKPMGAGDWFV